jgi:diguanylate cyclase (GGDEF)-like protein
LCIINLTGNIVINVFSLLILTVIFFHSIRHSETDSLQNRLFIMLLQVAALLLVLDVFGRFDGNPGTFYSVLNYWGNLLSFLTSMIMPSLWLLYVHTQVVHNEKRTLQLSYYLIALNVLNITFILLTFSTGWFYYIDQDNIYHRGPLYWIPVAIMIFMILSSIIFVVINRKQIETKYYFSLVFFSIPPFACIFLQLTFYGISLMLNSVVLSLLIVYFNIQNRYMYTDYLTGVSNRKKLEIHMGEKIAASTQSTSFSAILIDMDYFKSINDNFGHDMGDDALVTFVHLLKTCLRSNDFIARFGGDEFYIIMDISDQDILESTVLRIQDSVRKYNESRSKPYKLEFSVGYAVYDFNSNMKMDEFQKQIDMLMYVNKRLTKENFSKFNPA